MIKFSCASTIDSQSWKSDIEFKNNEVKLKTVNKAKVIKKKLYWKK